MVTPEQIRSYIEKGMPCDYIFVQGDGHHFQAVIVSAQFREQSRVRRHQIVYATLGDRMREEIHALSMRTLTPEEWAEQGGARG